MISVCVVTGGEVAVKTIVRILTSPPRTLTLREQAIALSHVTKYLPRYLEKEPNFLPKSELERLDHLVRYLSTLEAAQSDEDKSAQATIAHFAPQLLPSLDP